jgi:hypothetical protein
LIEGCWIKLCMELITLTSLNNHRSEFHNSSLGAVMDPCFYHGSSFILPLWWISLWISEHALIPLTESFVPEFGLYLVIHVLNLTVLIWVAPGIDVGWLAVCISVCLRSVTPYTFSNWQKYFFHLFKIFWESGGRYFSRPIHSSRLVPLVIVIYAYSNIEVPIRCTCNRIYFIWR